MPSRGKNMKIDVNDVTSRKCNLHSLTLMNDKCLASIIEKNTFDTDPNHKLMFVFSGEKGRDGIAKKYQGCVINRNTFP